LPSSSASRATSAAYRPGTEINTQFASGKLFDRRAQTSWAEILRNRQKIFLRVSNSSTFSIALVAESSSSALTTISRSSGLAEICLWQEMIRGKQITIGLSCHDNTCIKHAGSIRASRVEVASTQPSRNTLPARIFHFNDCHILLIFT
jgi:hypothetical protein